MDPEEDLFARAEKTAQTLPLPEGPVDAAVERLRAELVTFFEAVPEPPLYRRVDDPVRREAGKWAQRGQGLLARGLRLQREDASVVPLLEALKAYLVSLSHTEAGRVEAAEVAWREGGELQNLASAAQRAWRRSDETLPPVYDAVTGVSRYDPRPDPSVSVKLACPQSGCRTPAAFAFSPHHATQQFDCRTCNQPFLAYFAKSDELEVEKLSGGTRRYTFRVEELGGQRARITFDDASGAELSVGRKDLLAFLYTAEKQLRGVLNLTSSRLLWVSRAGPCFVATVAFGEDAKELATFRRFRDEVLLQSALGETFVRSYYRFGPPLAGWLLRHPHVLRRVRQVLRRWEQSLREP